MKIVGPYYKLNVLGKILYASFYSNLSDEGYSKDMYERVTT